MKYKNLLLKNQINVGLGYRATEGSCPGCGKVILNRRQKMLDNGDWESIYNHFEKDHICFPTNL